MTFLGALFTSGRLRLPDPMFGLWSLCRPGRTGTRPRAGALSSLQCWLAEDLSAPADSLPRELRRFLASPLGPRCSSLPRAFYARCAAAPVASCALFVTFHLAAELALRRRPPPSGDCQDGAALQGATLLPLPEDSENSSKDSDGRIDGLPYFFTLQHRLQFAKTQSVHDCSNVSCCLRILLFNGVRISVSVFVDGFVRGSLRFVVSSCYRPAPAS